LKFHKNKSEFVAYFCFCLTVQRSTDHVVHTECQRNRLLYYYVCSNTCIYLFKYKLIIIQKSFLTPCTDTTVMYSDNLLLTTVTAVLFLKNLKNIIYITTATTPGSTSLQLTQFTTQHHPHFSIIVFLARW
jgi:hypothetical protein